MKKLLLFGVLLLVVLLLSMWARNSNFNVFRMVQTATQPIASGSAVQPNHVQIVTTTPVPIEIFITITPSGFVPDVLMITAGTKITWINKSFATANVSSDPKGAYPDLNVGDFGQNATVSLVLSKQGRFHYINGKNPSQMGTLVVK